MKVLLIIMALVGTALPMGGAGTAGPAITMHGPCPGERPSHHPCDACAIACASLCLVVAEITWRGRPQPIRAERLPLPQDQSLAMLTWPPPLRPPRA